MSGVETLHVDDFLSAAPLCKNGIMSTVMRCALTTLMAKVLSSSAPSSACMPPSVTGMTYGSYRVMARSIALLRKQVRKVPSRIRAPRTASRWSCDRLAVSHDSPLSVLRILPSPSLAPSQTSKSASAEEHAVASESSPSSLEFAILFTLSQRRRAAQCRQTWPEDSADCIVAKRSMAPTANAGPRCAGAAGAPAGRRCISKR